MAVRPDFDESSFDESAYEEGGSGTLLGKIFLWLAWAAAAIFWGFMLTTGAGILAASDNPAIGNPAGGADAGGIGFLLMDVIGGMLILGLAMAWGTWRWASRDKRNDPMTEAATRVEYDLIERAGGDDDIHRSPEARRPMDRDAVRIINSQL
jgi:hypothetical protein